MKKILLDVHTHTVASGHANSSLQEMVHAAAEKGLEYLGITEHGPSIEGTCPPIYFRNMIVIPRQIEGVKLLMGCEINIIDNDGGLDLDDGMMDRLDIRIAGIHGQCWTAGSKEENTAGLVKVIQNPRINIISHPGDGTAELDFKAIVDAAYESHTLLEVNNHSLHPARHKTVAVENNLEILRLAKQKDMPIILGSDAHISYDVANYSRLYPLLEEVGFPDELIMNYHPEKFFEYTGLKWREEIC